MVTQNFPEEPKRPLTGAQEDILPQDEGDDIEDAPEFDPAALFGQPEEPEPAPEPEPEPEDSRLDNDIRELKNKYRDLEDRHHRTLEMLLENRQPGEQEKPESFGEIDPEVDKLVSPVVRNNI